MKGEIIIQRGFQGEPRRIDDAITDAPQTADQIAAKAKVTPARVKRHCEFWMSEKLFYDEAPKGSFSYRRSGEQPKGRRPKDK